MTATQWRWFAIQNHKIRVTPDPSNKLSRFYLGRLPKLIGASISCLTIAKVTKYTKSKHECSIQPLPKQSDGNKRPIFNYVLVPESIWKRDKFNQAVYKSAKADVHFPDVPKWKTLKRGSIVIVGALDRELDNFSGKTPYKIETERMHSFNDAVVLGVYKY